MLILCASGSFITSTKIFTGKKLYKSNKEVDTTGHNQPEAGTIENFQLEEVGCRNNNICKEFLTSVLDKIPVGLQEFLQCFCPILNTMGLFYVKDSADQVCCLDGIRLLTSLWVILGHTFGYLLPVLGNIAETVTLIDKVAFQIVINGYYSVDIFFELSGFLQTWQFLKRKGELKFFYSIFHRLVRLFPVYALVIGFETVMFHRLGSGPFWPVDARECKGYWWTNLIFANNILYSEHQCMYWAWYMASDFQYFVFSFLVLYLLKKWRLFGLATAGLFVGFSVVFSFYVTYMKDLFTGPVNNVHLFKENPGLMDEKFGKHFLELYIHPFGRYQVYVTGILLANFLYNIKRTTVLNISVRCKESISYVQGILVVTVSILCVFGLNAFGQGISTLVASFYNALHHLLFALCFAWLVYNCYTGKLGFLNRMLSARILVPLSRLTYCAYLLHPILMESYFLSLRAPFLYSHLALVILNMGFAVLTYVIAFAVTILCVAPFINLEHYIRQKFCSRAT